MGADSRDDIIIAELRTKIAELEQTIKKKDVEIGELREMHVIDEEMLEEQKEQMKKVEDDLNDQLDQHIITIKQLEYQLEEKDRMVEKLEFALIKFREKIEELNDQIRKQQEEIDGQMSAAEMIDRLTLKNLDLEEQIRIYKLDVADLEEMHQLNEALIEGKDDTERALKLQLDEQLIGMANLKRQISDWEDRAVDYERVIQKFRHKTADLNEEVQSLRDELATMRAHEEEKARSAGVESSLLTNANRTFTEIVEAELCSIELESSKQQISYLRTFLPNNFTKAGGDNDCLLLCVLFPRISVKALSLARLLQQKYPPVAGGLRREHVTLAHKAEQWAHVRRFNYQLHLLNNVVQKIVSVLKQSSGDKALSRLAAIQIDITLQEKSLDQYFGLFRQNRFDENTSVSELERTVKYFQRLFSASLSTEPYSARDDLRNTLIQVKEGLGWMQFNTQRLRHFLIVTQSSDLSVSSAGLDPSASIHSSLMAKSMTGSHISTASGSGVTSSAETEFVAFVDRLCLTLNECEGLAIRALNRIPAENDLILTSELSDQIISAISVLERCTNCIHECCAMAVSQLSAVDSEGLPAQQLLEFLRGEVEKFAGRLDSQRQLNAHFFDEKERGLDLVRSALDELSVALENSSMEIPPTAERNRTSASPIMGNGGGFISLLDRAHERKKDAVEADGLRWQLTKKDEELLKIQRVLKSRENDIGTLKLRLEMAEKQLAENGGKDGINAEIQLLKQQITGLENDMEQQKIEYEQQMGHLKKQLDEAHSRTREFSKKALFANMQQQAASAVVPSPGSTPAMSKIGSSSGLSTMCPTEANGDMATSIYQQQLDSTQQDLRQAKNKIRVLESQHLPDFGNIPCPSCTERIRVEQTELAEMLKESDELVKLTNRYQLKPLDILEYDTYRKTVENINFRSDSLRIRFQRWWRKFRPGEPLPEIKIANFWTSR